MLSHCFSVYFNAALAFQMELFQDFDEDLFTIKDKKTRHLSEYEALRCESEWFVGDHEDEPQNLIIKIKYDADYQFYKGNYESAINLYKVYKKYPTITQAIVRECLEGMARSYLGLCCFPLALKYAEQLYDNSSTFDTYTSSLSLLYHIYKANGNYENLIIVSQRLVSLHCTNYDIWLKLAIAYGLYFSVPLKYIFNLASTSPNLDPITSHQDDVNSSSIKNFLIQDSQTGSMKVLICLLHCCFHLKSVSLTSFGFAKDNNIIKQNLINLEIEFIKEHQKYKDDQNLIDSIRELYTGTCNTNKEVIQESYIDKSSFKFTNNEQVHYVLHNEIKEKFETRWLLNNKLLQCN